MGAGNCRATERPSRSDSSSQGIGPKLNCLGSCKENLGNSWARDRMWCQFVCSPGAQSKSHQNQGKKLQLILADADLALQRGKESGLLCQDSPCSTSAKTSLPATVTLAVHPAGNPQPRLHSCSGDNQPSKADQHFPCPGRRTGLKDTVTVLALLLYSSSLHGSGHIHCSDSPPAGSFAYAPQQTPRLPAGFTAGQRDLPVLNKRLGSCLLQALQA